MKLNFIIKTISYIFGAFALAALPALAGQNPAQSGKSVVLSVIENDETHAVAREVVREAYRRLGIEVVFYELPARRALSWANEGKTDGDVARIRGTEESYPNLIPVEVPVTVFKGVAFTKDVDEKIAEWADLRKYIVGIVRGIRYAEIGTQGMQVFEANNMTHLFTLLDSGRIQIAVAVREAGLIEARKNFKNKGIHIIGDPLYSAPLFHFVHKRNQALVSRLESVLEEMSRIGEVEAIHIRIFNESLGAQ